MPLSIGDQLGPYEILAPIGAGGMGEGYKARDTRLHREVAVKVLPQSRFTGGRGGSPPASRLLIGENPTDPAGQTCPRTSSGQKMVSGGVCARQRTAPDLRWSDRTRREEHQLWKSGEG